jgi:hypothetical protein
MAKMGWSAIHFCHGPRSQLGVAASLWGCLRPHGKYGVAGHSKLIYFFIIFFLKFKYYFVINVTHGKILALE